ncbi:N-carbamoylputrescine amidase [Rhodovibrionaceae bacterium A322]
MPQVTVAATQMACSWDREQNLDRAESLVRDAASQGANIILLQELFETPYFCPDELQKFFALARPFKDNPVIARFADLAKELGVVLPISFFEQANQAYFNSLAMIDADGTIMGLYRKSHIPDGPGYEEKFYFNPGDTGFKVWDTAFGKVGVGICWDQWFPECARTMALQGADLLLYPTAIGSEPVNPDADTKDHWQRTMQGHAAANMLALAASNRIGAEQSNAGEVTFYGSSFIAGPTGELVTSASRDQQEILTASFDFEANRAARAAWGFFRDRRPELYKPLMTLDGGL